MVSRKLEALNLNAARFATPSPLCAQPRVPPHHAQGGSLDFQVFMSFFSDD